MDSLKEQVLQELQEMMKQRMAERLRKNPSKEQLDLPQDEVKKFEEGFKGLK